MSRTITKETVLSRLKFISSVKTNEKIDVSTLTIVNDDFLTSFIRTFINRTESREKSMQFITEVVDKSFEYLDDINIQQELWKVCDGLRCLSETYKRDRMFISELDVLILRIMANLDSLGYEVREENFRVKREVKENDDSEEEN